MQSAFPMALLPAAVAAVLCTGLPVQARIVSEAALVSHCAEAAATELGVMMDDVLTLPAEKSGGKFHVYGQYPASGTNVTTFECVYDGNRNFRTLSVKAAKPQGGAAAGVAPAKAQNACTSMMGSAVNIEMVSPLRPGSYEIIMKDTGGPRRVACTVTDNGTINDWVEMQ